MCQDLLLAECLQQGNEFGSLVLVLQILFVFGLQIVTLQLRLHDNSVCLFVQYKKYGFL